MTPLVTPLAQPTLKLSKLMQEARQLGCETFFGTVHAVAVNNWLKRVLNKLIDMELDDELKLRVATGLMDKNAATLLNNLKLHSTPLMTWNYFV